MILLKSNLKKLLKLLGPLTFIFIFVRVVNTEATLKVLQTVRLDLLMISVLLFPVVNGALTLRWWLICRRMAINESFNDLFQVYYISWFLSALPLVGVAPAAKLLYLKELGKPIGTTAASITLDKIFDVLGLLVFGLFGLVYFPQALSHETGTWVAVAGCLVALLVLWGFRARLWTAFLAFSKRRTNKGLQKIGSALHTDLKEFWSRLDARFFLMMIGISIAIGVLRGLVLYVLAAALHISVGFGFIIACRAIIGLVNVIPVTISGLGTRDAVLLLMLPLAGATKEAAVALGVAAFLWTIGSKFSGVFFWLKRPLPSASLRNKESLAP